jgi:TrpR-related protein YerC/YecD
VERTAQRGSRRERGVDGDEPAHGRGLDGLGQADGRERDQQDATMTGGRDDWRTGEVEELVSAILRLESVAEAEAFFRDLCTLGELRDMAQRWAVVRMLDQGMHYGEISRRTGASTATITRIASWLNHGEGGYRLVLERTRRRDANAEPAPPAAPARAKTRTSAPRSTPSESATKPATIVAAEPGR